MADIAKVFMSGVSQAVRLPKKFRFDARVAQSGASLVLTPVETDAAHLFAELDAIGGRFPSRPAQGRHRRQKSF